MAACPSCGTANPGKTKRCPACGQDICAYCYEDGHSGRDGEPCEGDLSDDVQESIIE